MQNLREIGSRYNGLQDALDAQKAALRGARDPQERRALRRSAAETRRELKRLKEEGVLRSEGRRITLCS